MDAFLLAAGLGTRLGELTKVTPKPLVRVAGTPILQHVAERLVGAGADRLIINTHHLADQIVDFVRSMDDFGVEVEISHESAAPLETGGALKHAAYLLRGEQPFFLHNTDILTDIPLETLYREHLQRTPLATLAVMQRESQRSLLFDDIGLLGRVDRRKQIELRVREPVGPLQELAFAGIHVIAPEFPALLTETGAFSILDPYLRLAAEGHVVLPYRVDAFEWLDVGKPAQLAEANRRMGGG